MSEKIDLDKARAARREANNENPVVLFGGEDYVLPVELPYECLEALRGMESDRSTPGAMVLFVQALFGEADYARFKATRLEGEPPSMDDATEFVAQVMKAYGTKRPLASSAS